MTFQVFTELEQQEKFSPSLGVLCTNPRETVTTYFCKRCADGPGLHRRDGGDCFPTALGQVLWSVIAGCGRQGPGHIAQIPQLRQRWRWLI